MKGLGRLSDVLAQALFPVPQELGLDERTKNALQKQSLMQLGLGMMGAQSQGAGLGQGLNMAYQQAQQGLGQGVQQSFIAKRSQREDQRLDMQDERAQRYDTRQDQALQQQALDRATQNARYSVEGQKRDEQNVQQQSNWERQFKASRQGVATKPNWKLTDLPQADGTIQKVWVDENAGPASQPTPFGDPTRPASKLTADQRLAENYAGRMAAAEPLLGDFKPGFKDYVAGLKVMEGGAITSSIANSAISEDGGKYYQAAADWVRAKLRRESGATIPPDEMAQEIKTYFPMPGDSAARIAQKKTSRNQALIGMQTMAGSESSGGGTFRTYNPKTGKIE